VSPTRDSKPSPARIACATANGCPIRLTGIATLFALLGNEVTEEPDVEVLSEVVGPVAVVVVVSEIVDRVAIVVVPSEVVDPAGVVVVLSDVVDPVVVVDAVGVAGRVVVVVGLSEVVARVLVVEFEGVVGLVIVIVVLREVLGPAVVVGFERLVAPVVVDEVWVPPPQPHAKTPTAMLVVRISTMSFRLVTKPRRPRWLLLPPSGENVLMKVGPSVLRSVPGPDCWQL
jgi:hypothetical protein